MAQCRNLKVTPHVAQNLERLGGSAIDARTTHHPGYAISQRKKRKRIEECFGWLKTIALLRKVRHRGVFKVGWVFTFATTAYNLVRMRNPSDSGDVSQGRSLVRRVRKTISGYQQCSKALLQPRDRDAWKESKSCCPFFRILLDELNGSRSRFGLAT